MSSLASCLVIALNALDRIIGAHLPAHRQRKHFAQYRNDTVGLVRAASLANLAMQSIDIGEGDVSHFGVGTEVRANMPSQHALITAYRFRTLPWQVFFLEPLDEVGHGGICTLLLQSGERVTTLIDQLAKTAGFNTYPPVVQLGKPPMVNRRSRPVPRTR